MLQGIVTSKPTPSATRGTAAPVAAAEHGPVAHLGRDAFVSSPPPQAKAYAPKQADPIVAPHALALTLGATVGGMALLLGGATWPIGLGVGVAVAGVISSMVGVWKAGARAQEGTR